MISRLLSTIRALWQIELVADWDGSFQSVNLQSLSRGVIRAVWEQIIIVLSNMENIPRGSCSQHERFEMTHLLGFVLALLLLGGGIWANI
jgi:hypothetical protein